MDANIDSMELEYIVLDSGALIKGYGLELFKKANKIVTISEVITEIRDSKARDLLQRLPFDLIERTPSIEAVKTGKLE